TWATASGANRAGTTTKIDRTTPLLRVSTNNSRSEEACSSSSRSSTAASSVGPTATPSSFVSTPSTCAARSRIWSTALCSPSPSRSEEHTSELQSRENLVCRLLLEKKKNTK